ncbi:hypothetical protein [Thioalkalivibrio sp. ALE9]|uniref:hypothetical protein n=1 Tax=Thioalkalivibrio sp. ALE9 TaxID=1158169 RepID=UPI0009D9AE3F|nr:hypothetical protein [Thioalkalivibrio sp. ALE9]
MKARSSSILGTLGLRPLRAAPAVRAPGTFGWRCLSLGVKVGIRSVLTFPSRMEPLGEGVMGRPVFHKFGALDV